MWSQSDQHRDNDVTGGADASLQGSPNLLTRRGVLLVGLSCVSLSSARAHSYKLASLSIGHLWMPVPADEAGQAAFGILWNRGGEGVALVRATSPEVRSISFRLGPDRAYTTVEQVEVAPGAVVPLAPWRTHMWFEGFTRRLAAGDQVPVLLDFGAAGRVGVQIAVENVAGHS